MKLSNKVPFYPSIPAFEFYLTKDCRRIYLEHMLMLAVVLGEGTFVSPYSSDAEVP